MKLQIIFKDLPEWKREYLQADFNFFNASAKFEMFMSLDKMKGNRGLLPRMVKLIKDHNATANITVEALMASLDAMKELEIFKHDIRHEGNLSVVDFEANEDYFDMVEMLQRSNPLHLHIGYDRNKLLKHMEKELTKTYGNVEIEIVPVAHED